jgi:hypothetical protein
MEARGPSIAGCHCELGVSFFQMELRDPIVELNRLWTSLCLSVPPDVGDWMKCLQVVV